MASADLLNTLLNCFVVLAAVYSVWPEGWPTQTTPSLDTGVGDAPSDRIALANRTDGARARAEGAVWGALIGDALALQTHYEYDAQKIRGFYRVVLNGSTDVLAAKLRRNAEVLGMAVTPNFEGADMNNWHPGKEGGDQTDYGDCVVMALEFVSERPWSAAAFEEHWWAWIQSYGGYVNMATKAILRRRRSGISGPAGLGWPPAEDLFAVCRLPALLPLALRGGSDVWGQEACEWSTAADEGGEGIVLEPYPVQLASPFKSEREAEEQCEHYGAALCGGITCWSTRASGRACTLVLPGARRIQVERADSAESRRLLGCTNSSGLRWLTRAAMESASVQYATEHTFFAASFLAAMAHSLVRLGGGGRPGPAELRALARRSASGLAPRARRFMGRVLDAVERKLAEASAGGPGWGDDPLEADDLAIASFRFTAAGLPEYAAYPCDSSDCGYWGHSGKASPTVPALVAVLYLLLRYADRPLQELLAANAMLGGDTAARAVPLGMLAGAAQGSEAVPQGLLGQLRSAPRVAERLRRL